MLDVGVRPAAGKGEGRAARRCGLCGRPLLKKREKWRTLSYFGRC